jgi:hypothetical protein
MQPTTSRPTSSKRSLRDLLPTVAGTLMLALCGAGFMLATAGCNGDRAAQAPKPEHSIPESSTAAADWHAPGMQVKVINPGAKHLDAIVTRDTFNKLFPQSVWFKQGDIVGMYNRESKMTFIVVSEHTFAAWNDELSAITERLCHEKAHRADDLYDGDPWSELRDTSSAGLQLDTHHFGHEQENQDAHNGVFVTSNTGTMAVAMNNP